MLISDESDPVLSKNAPGPKRSTIATIFFSFSKPHIPNQCVLYGRMPDF